MPVSAACAMWPCKDPLLLCRQLSLQQAPARPQGAVFTVGRATASTWGDGAAFLGPIQAEPSQLWVDGGETIMEQFNPSLRNFIAMGKNYEKALAGVTFAAKGYFDALVKMGELASESQGSKELVDCAPACWTAVCSSPSQDDRGLELGWIWHGEKTGTLMFMVGCAHRNSTRHLQGTVFHVQGPSSDWGLLMILRPTLTLQAAPRLSPSALLEDDLQGGGQQAVWGWYGDVLFQMAEVHRQIQNQLEEMVSVASGTSTLGFQEQTWLKSFHNELLTQLEQKVELDSRYLSAALKKYQTEQRSKGDALDKCQAELKKLRKKSQGSKNPQKYSDKELQVWAAQMWAVQVWATQMWAVQVWSMQVWATQVRAVQYIDAISNKQGELENYVSDGYKTALTEERRRFCFLVEKQCAVAKNSAAYHSKGKELLAQKLPLWQQACADPNKIPDRAVQLMQQIASSNGSILPSSLSASKSNLVISDPIPGAKPLPVPPELAPFVGRMSAQENVPVMNGVAGPDSEDYNPWADRKAAQPKSLSPPQSQSKLSDSYSNTLPVRKSVTPKNSYATTENKTLPRSSSMAAGLERNGRMRVKAIFSHAAGDNSTLLSFKEGDLITLLVPEARDGWHYGESEKTKMRGWFPFSYTRVLDSDGSDRLHMSLQQGKSSSTGNLLDKDDLAIPPPDYGTSSRAFPTQTAGTFKQRPYSVAVPAFSQKDLSSFQVSPELLPLPGLRTLLWSEAGQPGHAGACS
ncbi:Brain-specific angiogenesis inhibitor 1-associated protein 2 [Microtus ochrogaster]|uniref:Brain-specific angiogenesis inhibitor 1-associated protein 2 n=1 Tax=Microtus ochrogaster TaxID=79684 RepID=A0A8J6GVW6_MICOH|nr:Brain-specific angiogenesis inhibitor 1-associated protein 2 [Microtus ochrogaster]